MTGLQSAAPSFELLPLHSLDGPFAFARSARRRKEMGALIRSIDWSQSPIGAVETWSPALWMMVSILLANRFPLLLWWGPQYIQIYNDAYRPIPGAKHPCALGQPASKCWSEIWHVIGPLIDKPFHGGPATWMEDILLEINRHGFMEELHFTIAYSPVPDETVPSGIGACSRPFTRSRRRSSANAGLPRSATWARASRRRALRRRPVRSRPRRCRAMRAMCRLRSSISSTTPPVRQSSSAQPVLLMTNGCACPC